MDFLESIGNAQEFFAFRLTKQIPSFLYAFVVGCMRGIFVTTYTVNISASCSLNSRGV